MEYPVLCGGMTIGRMRVYNEGLMTVFDARIRPRRELCRLWLIGREGSAYLGVPVPCGGCFRLVRRFSRRELAGLPMPILYAATEKPAPLPAAAEKKPPRDEWTPAGMGTLMTRREDGVYIALPAALRREVAGVKTELINGETYMIFKR